MLYCRKTSGTGNDKNDRTLSRKRTAKICELGFKNG